MTDLDEAKRICDAATGEAWAAYWQEPTGSNDWSGKVMIAGLRIASIDRSPAFWSEDGKFIAYARTALPQAIAEIRELRDDEQILVELFRSPEWDREG